MWSTNGLESSGYWKKNNFFSSMAEDGMEFRGVNGYEFISDFAEKHDA